MFSYYVLYKPYQVLCQFSAAENKRTLKDILDVEQNVYPVGRLDYDSEGLLLLTNDPSLNALLLQPLRGHQRSYWVQVEGIPKTSDLLAWTKGVQISIDGKAYKTLPATAALLHPDPDVPERFPPIRFRKNIPTSWIKLSLIEGKNRQVRKMTAALGYPTLRLIRFSIGKLDIAGWQPGEFRKFGREDLIHYLA